MNIEEYIEKIKKKYGEYIFLNGFCYIFCKILQKKYGGVIYTNMDHCKLKLNNAFYDIQGKAITQGTYLKADPKTCKYFEQYRNF